MRGTKADAIPTFKKIIENGKNALIAKYSSQKAKDATI